MYAVVSLLCLVNAVLARPLTGVKYCTIKPACECYWQLFSFARQMTADVTIFLYQHAFYIKHASAAHSLPAISKNWFDHGLVYLSLELELDTC